MKIFCFVEWKISFKITSCGGNAAMYEPLFISLRIPRNRTKIWVNFNEDFPLKHVLMHRIILRLKAIQMTSIFTSTIGIVILKKRLVLSLGVCPCHIVYKTPTQGFILPNHTLMSGVLLISTSWDHMNQENLFIYPPPDTTKFSQRGIFYSWHLTENIVGSRNVCLC